MTNLSTITVQDDDESDDYTNTDEEVSEEDINLTQDDVTRILVDDELTESVSPRPDPLVMKITHNWSVCDVRLLRYIRLTTCLSNTVFVLEGSILSVSRTRTQK